MSHDLLMSCDGRKSQGGSSAILKQLGGSSDIFDNLGGSSDISRFFKAVDINNVVADWFPRFDGVANPTIPITP
jgi:hypothetical protein